MNPKGIAVVTGSTIATAAIVGGVMYGAYSNAPRSKDESQFASSGGRVPASASALAGVVPAVVSDESCREDAVPALGAGVDQRVAEEMTSNPASQADPDRAPMNRDEAVAAARDLSMIASEQDGSASTVDLSRLTSAAVQVPFESANKWISGSVSENSLVAGNTCVWVVTVNAPFRPRSAPDPSVATTFDSYTAMFDSRSGQYLGLSAGTDAGSVITGDQPSK